MAVTDYPEVFSNIALEELFFRPQRSALVFDRSAELAESGRTLHIFDYITSMSAQQYTPNNDGSDAWTWAFLDSDDRELPINQNYIVQFAVREEEQRDSAIELVAQGQRQAARAAATHLNDHLRTVWDAAVVPPAAIFSLTSMSDWDTEAGRKAFLGGFIDAQTYLDGIGWPEDGRFAVMHPNLRGLVQKYMILDKGSFGTGVISERTFAGQRILNVAGFDLIMDNGMNGALDTAADPDPEVHIGLRGTTQHYAQTEMRTDNVDLLQQRNQFGTGMVTHMRYNSIVPQTDRMAEIRLPIA